ASIVTGSIVVVPVAGARQTAGRWRLTIHLRTRFALMPCDIATDATDASPARHSSTTACLKRSSNTRLPSRRIPITGSTLLDDSTCIASTPQHGGHNRRGLAYSTQGCQYRTLTRIPGHRPDSSVLGVHPLSARHA